MALKVCRVCGDEKYHTAFPERLNGRCKQCAAVDRVHPDKKRCRDCGETKAINDFYRRYGRSYGYKTRCKKCDGRFRKKYEAGIRKRFKERHPDYDKYRALKRKYGITRDQYDTMLELQGGVCAICGGPPSGVRALSVDHDHKTGRIRGLLCDDCNTTLGRVKDSVAHLEALIGYLEASWA